MKSKGEDWIVGAPGRPGVPLLTRPWRARFLAIFVVSVTACNSWTGSIGAILAKDNRDGRVFVREVPPDMAAGRGGVLVDDEVVAVDGHPVRGMTKEDLHRALAGKVGTKVKIQISRNGEMREVLLERGPLKGPQPD
jgi:C-terminal processing protease CtpA/Prc